MDRRAWRIYTHLSPSSPAHRIIILAGRLSIHTRLHLISRINVGTWITSSSAQLDLGRIVVLSSYEFFKPIKASQGSSSQRILSSDSLNVLIWHLNHIKYSNIISNVSRVRRLKKRQFRWHFFEQSNPDNNSEPYD